MYCLSERFCDWHRPRSSTRFSCAPRDSCRVARLNLPRFCGSRCSRTTSTYRPTWTWAVVDSLGSARDTVQRSCLWHQSYSVRWWKGSRSHDPFDWSVKLQQLPVTEHCLLRWAFESHDNIFAEWHIPRTVSENIQFRHWEIDGDQKCVCRFGQYLEKYWKKNINLSIKMISNRNNARTFYYFCCHFWQLNVKCHAIFRVSLDYTQWQMCHCAIRYTYEYSHAAFIWPQREFLRRRITKRSQASHSTVVAQ